ncbi:PEP-CTERM sorting domain-containing protein [Marinobacter sp. NP-4(2019)]|uniref:PEP-CTERM sorting domain-containing protein n=1 Tax=Marinobacter sp. NP-4(2019) TaxID=2488665 RepID=UPI0013E078D0|nr:PEP-CTERM sorting domain-containing protein [Marinobacter sp. NP-4(2019)]
MPRFTLVTLLAAVLFFPTLTSAAQITASYDVNLNSSDPGLVVNSADIADNPFSFNLEEGESNYFTLFKIWTNEETVNSDDKDPQSISVDFNFTSPEALFGSVNGETDGVRKILLANYQAGHLTWGGPLDLVFGALGDGLLRVTLFDAVFNEGYIFGLHEGKTYGAKVKAKIELISDASQVSEPGTLALLGLGLLGLGLRARHRTN